MDGCHGCQGIVKPAASQVWVELLICSQIVFQGLVKEQGAPGADLMPALMVFKA